MFDISCLPPTTMQELTALEICLHDITTFLPGCRKHSVTLVSYPDTIDISGGARMEYQGYVVRTFEREPGKWRAKILRPVGKPLVTGRKRIVQFVTGVDRTTSSAALLVALEAIDAGAFSRPATLHEKFWRRRGQRSNGPISDRTVPPAQRVTQKINGSERTRSGR
jgi:hypothetical protein